MSPATLSRSVLTAAPGQAVGGDVLVTNPTAEVLDVDIDVDGPAAEWAVVLPAAHVLEPGESRRARITFTVPERAALAGSTRQFVVRVRGGSPVELVGRIEIAEVRDLRISIHPLVTRARGATIHTVMVENRGTDPGRVALAAADVGGHLALCLADKRVTVAAGAQATVALTVAPRRRFLTGRARPHPFTVEVRPETGPPVIAAATRFQEPVRWRGALAAALAVGVGSAGALAMRSGRGSDGRLRVAVVPAPVTSVALASACPTRNTGSLGLDIAGFAYCPGDLTVAAGAGVGWTNADLAPHTVTYDGTDGPVDSGSMAQGQSWSTRLSQAGTYRYYCRFHPGMSGTIVVVSRQ